MADWLTTAPTKIGEYRVEGELGRGAMSVVYRVSRNGQQLALKILALDAATQAVDVHLQFRREVAAIARLDHPVLVRVLEAGDHDGRPYLVMELAEGEALDRRIARQRLLDDDETLALGRAIGEALAEIHRFGLIHRDIKPANIMLGESGRVRLIDLGLVTGAIEDDIVAGTLHYASPEQVGVIKCAVGAPADLYALGATLFECLTGHPPFVTDSQADFLHQLATVPAPDLLAVRPATRPGLAAVIARLLAKDPDDRYQTARGLLHDLTQLEAIEEALRQGQPAPLASRDVAISTDPMTPLVGRSEELEQLSRSWQRARQGMAAFVRIEGESGCGKTRLASELIARAEAEGALVLSGKCQELEAVPFGPLREAVEQLAARIQRMAEPKRSELTERIRDAADESAPLVKRLSLGISRLIGDTRELRTLDPDAEQQRYYEALASFFRSLGTETSPLLLLVDDVQWLDEGSLRVLARIAADGSPGCLLVLATARSAVEYAAPRERFAEAIKAASSERLDLCPLSVAAVGELIEAHLGSKGLDGPVVDKLAALTRGNPLAVCEYLRALLDAGVVRPVAGRWHTDPAAIEAIDLPRDVVELVLRRLDALGSEAARLLAIAGILGGRFSTELLGRISGMAPEVQARGLEELVRVAIVERSYADSYVFLHDRVREAAVERLAEEERRTIHQAIAAALEALPELSPADIYALARHHAEGRPEANPRRVAETSLAAGLLALEEHASEEAFGLLDRALVHARRGGCYDELAPRLLEGLGRACAMTGRLQRAFEHLEEALARAGSKRDRFRLQHLLTLTFASQGRNDEALAALHEAFALLGRPYPRTLVLQALTLVAIWLLAVFLRWTGLGRGRARGAEQERRRVLSQLHYAGSMIALFQGRPFLMVQFIVRDFYNVHFLGPTVETAFASTVFGTVLATFQLRSVMRRYTRLGEEMAEQLGDAAMLAVCRAYTAVATKWAGDLVRGNELLIASLPALHRQVPGSWYAAMIITEQAYSYLHAGASRAAIAHVRANLDQLERTNNLMFRYNTASVLYAELMVTGETAAAAQLWARLEQQYQPLSRTIYVRLARVIAMLEVLLDQGETGPAVDATIAEFRELLSEDYYSNAARMLAGYARLAQLEKAAAGERRAARRRLEQVARELSLRALVPVFQCHPPVWRAALARMDGRFAKARRLLERADRLATRCQSRRAGFYIALERARLDRATGGATARFHAQAALEIARSEGWPKKIARLREEFGLVEEQRQAAANPALALTTVSSLSAEQARRYADALLQVCLASATTLDGDVLARNALVEVARVLGAERALFFLADPASGELALKASTGADSATISRTVVQRVAASRKPLVLTGTDEGEALGSQSILAHGLRSIIAAPLMMRERLIGVVYLDSRLAKGIFTEKDLDLLLGISHHIAIAIETARMARLEAERSALRRDMELLGAVQSLLLPRDPAFSTGRLRCVSFYQPATNCGGDWWWYERLPEGALLLLVGDVSGHGAGPAMITAAIAGAFRSQWDSGGAGDPLRLLQALDRQVRSFGRGVHMTLSLLRVDPLRQEIRWWSAAAPPIFVLGRDGATCLAQQGTMLGSEGAFHAPEKSLAFLPGDRLLVCTDGLLELREPGGRELGARRVAKLLSATRATPLQRLPELLREEIGSFQGNRPQDDDITFVMIEADEPARTAEMGLPIQQEENSP